MTLSAGEQAAADRRRRRRPGVPESVPVRRVAEQPAGVEHPGAPLESPTQTDGFGEVAAHLSAVGVPSGQVSSHARNPLHRLELPGGSHEARSPASLMPTTGWCRAHVTYEALTWVAHAMAEALRNVKLAVIDRRPSG